MKRRIITVVLAFVMVFSATAIAFGADTSDINNDVVVKELSSIEDASNIEDADVLKISSDLADATNSEEAKMLFGKSDISILENVTQKEIETLSEKLDAIYSYAELENGQRTIGAVVTKSESGDFKVSEVIAEVVDEMIDDEIIRTDEKEAEEFLDWLSENAEIDADSIYSDYMWEQNISSVQSAASNGFFGDNSVYMYLYTAPYQTNNTEYLDHKDSGRYLLATVKVGLEGYKNATIGTTTYDSFKGTINVAPQNDLKITSFSGNLYTAENSRYDIMGATALKSDSGSGGSVTVNLPKDFCSPSGSLTYSYTYSTAGKNITNKVLYEKYKSRWIVNPISPKKNESYKIMPSMVLKAANGTTKKNMARASLSYLKLKKMAGAYWISDKDIVVKLAFKNHKQVSE